MLILLHNFFTAQREAVAKTVANSERKQDSEVTAGAIQKSQLQ
jgi:hypothetical protein